MCPISTPSVSSFILPLHTGEVIEPNDIHFTMAFYAGVPAVFLRGLTLLKRSALSGVVSGQSASNVIGIVLAFSSSFFSSSEKASSLFISSLSSIIFTIVQPPFKVCIEPCGNKSRDLSRFSVCFNPDSLSILESKCSKAVTALIE